MEMEMEFADIQKISVIGAGQMGHQIAMLCALGGYETTIQDVNEIALKTAKEKITSIMERWVQKGKMTDENKEAAFRRLSLTTSLEEAANQADLVIEAVVEKLDVKREVFKQLDKLAPKHTIFASNSSTIVNSMIAEVTTRPDKFLNMHFFFPPLVMDCVEVVKSEQTSDETAQIAMGVCEKINRTAVLLKKEIYGFIANRIVFAIANEAMYLYENGYADFKDIDLICKKALNHPMGPFELADLSGIDVGYYASLQRYEETGNPAYKPSKIVEEKVKLGHLGRKTGRGYYVYEKEGVKK